MKRTVQLEGNKTKIDYFRIMEEENYIELVAHTFCVEVETYTTWELMTVHYVETEQLKQYRQLTQRYRIEPVYEKYYNYLHEADFVIFSSGLYFEFVMVSLLFL